MISVFPNVSLLEFAVLMIFNIVTSYNFYTISHGFPSFLTMYALVCNDVIQFIRE